MKRNLRAASLLLVVFLAVHCFSDARAACINVKHDGAQQFSADALSTINGNDWNFTGNCGTTPPPPPPAPGRQTIGRVAYQSSGVAVRDLTEFSSVFGHATADDAVIAFPGRHNSQPTIIEFVRGGYIALHVHTNALGQVPTYGWAGHTEYNFGFDPSVSWSRAAGDFSASLGANCFSARVQSGGQLAAYATPLAGYPAFCHLPPNADVFFNIKMADPTQVTSTCAASSRTCPFGMNNNFN